MRSPQCKNYRICTKQQKKGMILIPDMILSPVLQTGPTKMKSFMLRRNESFLMQRFGCCGVEGGKVGGDHWDAGHGADITQHCPHSPQSPHTHIHPCTQISFFLSFKSGHPHQAAPLHGFPNSKWFCSLLNLSSYFMPYFVSGAVWVCVLV